MYGHHRYLTNIELFSPEQLRQWEEMNQVKQQQCQGGMTRAGCLATRKA